MADAEDVKDALKALLLSNHFQEELQKYWNSKPNGQDDIPLSLDVLTDTTVSTAPIANNEAFPSCEFDLGMDRNVANDSGLIEMSHEIGVFYFDRGDVEVDVARKIERFLAFVRRYLTDYPYLSQIENAPIVIGDTNYTPFLPAHSYSGRPFTKGGVITLYVKTLG